MFWFLLLLVLVSGAAGLLYEVVWARALVHTLGSSAQAVSSVLAAFLGGLAIGAAVLGRRANRSARPLIFYASLEVVVAGYAIAFPLFQAALDRWVLWTATLGEPTEPMIAALRFLGTFVTLLPATAAMGGTIPVLCRFAIRKDESLGTGVASLYAVNTLGASLGCLLTGFVAIPALGLRGSLWLGAFLNIAVAVAAIGWARMGGHWSGVGAAGAGAAADPAAAASPPGTAPSVSASATSTESASASRRQLAVFAAFAISGFTALGYEVLWTRVLVFFVKSVTYGFSFMLATFLLGLVIGSVLIRRWVDRPGHALPALVATQCLAGAVAFSSIFLLITRTETLRAMAPTPGGALGALYGPLAFLIVATILPAGVLFGATFPLAVRLLTPRHQGASGRVGLATLANTGGAILGAFLVGFVFLPAFGVVGSLRGLVTANAAAALILAFGAPAGRNTRIAGSVAAALLVMVAGFGSGDFFVERLEQIRPGDLIFVDEGEDVIVTVHEETDRGETIRTIYVNGSSYTGSRFFARRYMKTMGHLPLLLADRRDNALVICLGTGMTLSALARHEVLEQIACAELSNGVREALPLFASVNDSVATNPRVRVHVQDGRHWVLTTPTKWDVITLEPPPPLNAGVGDLYSKEFYEICRDHLAPGGVVCQWFPMHSQTIDEYKMGLASFAAVFPNASLWLPVGRNAIGIGIREDGTPWSFARIQERFRDTAVRDGLRVIGFDSPEALLATMILDAEGIARFVGDAPLVTDDRPRLEFHDLSKAGQRFPAGELLDQMMRLRIDPGVWLNDRGRAGGLDRDRYTQTKTALNHFYRGAFLFEARRPQDAALEWQEALRNDPENLYYQSILGTGASAR